MNLFSRISDIDLADETTWKGRIFITLDIDWAADFVLNRSDRVVGGRGHSFNMVFNA